VSGTKNYYLKIMRILQVNKFHYPRGGADKYYLELGKSLEKTGHKVAYFSMKHPKNLKTLYSKHFISRLSFNEGGLVDKIKAPGRMIYSLEAKRKFRQLVNDFKPDIIHIHNIYHQISPSILDVARAKKIPVVMHLHDYKLICPNYQLFCQGKICEACKKNKYFNCVKKRCFKNSFSKSLLAALEMTIHHNILGIYKKGITLFIAPSHFMKEKVGEYGWDKERIKVIYNPFSANLEASDSEIENIEKQNYLLYFGRLSKEKGLNILISAISKSGSQLKIAGIGPEEKNLKELSYNLKASVEFLGFKSGKELKDLIIKARAVIIPSIWYENMPLSMLEALNLGTPVIASEIGGMPEIIKTGYNGLLFKPGNEEDLVEKISSINNYDLKKLSQQARNSTKDLTANNNLNKVVEIYKEILGNK